MPDAPAIVQLRVTRWNQNSIAALLAVLEADLPQGTWEPRLVDSVDEIHEASLVLYSFMSPQAAAVRAELASLRQRLGADLPLMAGGPHPSGAPDDTLAMGFRWVAIGEAGPAFSRHVRAVLQGPFPAPGILEPERNDSLERYGPWPASGRLFSPIELTRGCPHPCAFCQTPAMFGRLPRHRSVESLRPIFDHAVRTGHSCTRFVAPNAFSYGVTNPRRPDLKAIESLLKAARQSGFEQVYFGTFPSEVRPESVNSEVLALVRPLCDNPTLAIGIQSGSDPMLRRMRRGHSVDDGLRAVALAAAAGFTPRVDFIFGLPGETDEDRAATRRLIRQLHDDFGAHVHAHQFTPLPGTPWANERPTRIDPPTRALIDALRGSGRMTGVRPRELAERW